MIGFDRGQQVPELLRSFGTQTSAGIKYDVSGLLGTVPNGMKLVISIEGEATYVSPVRHQLRGRPIAWNPA